MRSIPRRTASLAGLALALTCATSVPVALAGPNSGALHHRAPKTVHVSGRQVPVDVERGRYVMRGDLVGKWRYLPQKEPLHDVPTLYVEAGKEWFKGCLDRKRDGRCDRGDPRGEIYFAFLYWASYEVKGQDRSLIKGQCVHPVIGGRGDFAGARGRLDMVDLPRGQEVVTTYRGDITLNAVPGEGAAKRPTSATTATAATSGPRAC